ncbi:MAG: aminotransferase class I/II-fold pyridoxal phosphate-dependent enzyme [Firmicutes bacterium]|nr:aminotransferase class I/II-fold pyridoxal phosphate-dependent enzyme [Bacillota bacterium]
MQYFASDYMEGAHPLILQRLMEINMEKNSGYGTDEHCERAKEKIRKACNAPEAEIFFLVGGTQTNATVIGAALKSYQGVIAAETGHISCHEAGAIEYGGHKVITLPQYNGKLSAADVEKYLETYYGDETHEHIVMPGMVYISHPTEYGTVYTEEELKALKEVCVKYDMYLYADGARMGYGLGAEGTEVTLETIAKYCDMFYIGGTKVGALFGEAVVFTKPKTIPHFFSITKQNGALLAKGWLLGTQFDVLFTDDLYLKLGREAVRLAIKLKNALREKGYEIFMDSPTNQQFVVLENEKMKEISEKVTYSFWEKLDENHTVVRFATSWATTEEDVDKLIEML